MTGQLVFVNSCAILLKNRNPTVVIFDRNVAVQDGLTQRAYSCKKRANVRKEYGTTKEDMVLSLSVLLKRLYLCCFGPCGQKSRHSLIRCRAIGEGGSFTNVSKVDANSKY